MSEVYEIIKSAAAWLFLALIGVIVWFFKTIHSQHSAMFEHYTKNKEHDFDKIYREIESVKLELKKVEFDSKRYWNDHKNQMETNHEIILERINHSNENFKAGTIMIKEMIEHISKRIDKLER